jgi:hypothetical protein
MGMKRKETMKTQSTETNRHRRAERVGETTPQNQPDTRQPLAIPLRMTYGADEGPDLFTDHWNEGI